VIHGTVCVVHIIILKVIFGVGKLSSALASASKFCLRPRPRPRRFVLGLGLGDLSSASASRICPRLTSLVIATIGVLKMPLNPNYPSIDENKTVLSGCSWWCKSGVSSIGSRD